MKNRLIDMIAENNSNNGLLEEFKICIVSNINTEPYFSTFLAHEFKNLNYKVCCRQIQLENISTDEYATQYKDADYIVLWMNLDQLVPDFVNDIMSEKMCLDEYKDYILNLYDTTIIQYKDIEDSKVICIGLEDYFIANDIFIGRTINKYQIADAMNTKLIQKYNSVKFINLKKVIAEVGISNTYDMKNKYRWSSPYSSQIYQQVSHEVYKQYCIRKHQTPKCLVLDCDNVLWGGILSEDGLENIKIGELGIAKAYQDFQRFVLQLYHSGIILAVSSKNDLSDVLEVFEKHHGMLLKKENIAIFSANWEDKASNIKRISEQLNIGLDSMVFVDDSDFEINLVKQMIPEVACIKFDVYHMYSEFEMFHLDDNLTMANIKIRNESYVTNVYRNQLKKKADSYNDYLQQLDSKIDIHRTKLDEISRISELSLRAHKFTNGQRYDAEELKLKYSQDSYELYSVYLSDRFSNLGLVGAFGVSNNTKLDLFVMSCRANGRKLEDNMLDEIKDKYDIKDVFLKSTNKNQSVADWLRTLQDEERA